MNKTFLIINGKELHLISKETLKDAVTYAENYMDHSKEVIVREVNNYFTTNQS